MRLLLFLLLAWWFTGEAAERGRLVNPATYLGMADASGGVAVGSNLFVVADDESNAIRLYSADTPGPPLQQYDFSAFVQVERKHVEADLEAAARIGDRIYWIGSHGRNKNGRERPNRGCFFGTAIRDAGGQVQVLPVGQPYRALLRDLEADPRFQGYRLAQAAARGPKEPAGLNIEGLSATPEGHLLIGFRNPIPDGKALLIPMTNPTEVVGGSRPAFEPGIQLDLDGLGIRDIALYQQTYIIIAGSYHGGGKFELFRWSGGNSGPERIKIKRLNDYHPEAIIIYPGKGLREFQLLSDDGTEPVDGVPGKEVKDPSKKTFRSVWVREEE
ncbi:MAG TPA: DUF3616 domain-containing protein [Verrucomicrobiae bacterium]